LLESTAAYTVYAGCLTFCSVKMEMSGNLVLTSGWCRSVACLCGRAIVYAPCLNKMISDIIDCNLKRDYQILIIFVTNILDTTSHYVTVQVPTSPNVCFCTTCKKQNKRNMPYQTMSVNFISSDLWPLTALT